MQLEKTEYKNGEMSLSFAVVHSCRFSVAYYTDFAFSHQRFILYYTLSS